MGQQGVEQVREEVANTAVEPALPDKRLRARRDRVVELLHPHPDHSYPEALGENKDIEGFYRLVENSRSSPEGLLGPHYTEVWQRAAQCREVALISDTTTVTHPTADEQGGFGPVVGGKSCGYFSHLVFAVDAEQQVPLGTLGLETWARRRRTDGGGKQNSKKRWHASDKESLRWLRTALQASKRLGEEVRGVHVMDREADSYELFSELCASGDDFVIRLNHDRKLASGRLSEHAEVAETKLEREVKLSERRSKKLPRDRQKHPPRRSRWARLAVKATHVTVERPPKLPELPEQLELSLVYVVEEAPPEGEDPVCWTLLTTKPVETVEQVAYVVDLYRGRWLIEEFFKAIKTGCNFKNRRFETLHSSVNALALTVAIAYKVLLLRYLAHQEPTVPAERVLHPDRIRLLREVGKKRLQKRDRLPPRATVRHVLHAIAKLGGHLRHNGPPGWQVLGRGWKAFLSLEDGYRLWLPNQTRPPVTPEGWDLMVFHER